MFVTVPGSMSSATSQIRDNIRKLACTLQVWPPALGPKAVLRCQPLNRVQYTRHGAIAVVEHSDVSRIHQSISTGEGPIGEAPYLLEISDGRALDGPEPGR